jgi:ectoine hydroxylase-related dioxygenase (phytanoyl-CoA dioxygenase family)
MSTSALSGLLTAPYTVTEEQRAFYRAQGYIKLKEVLAPEVLEYYGREIARLVRQLNTNNVPLAQRGTYGKAFLQVMNLWTKSPVVQEFVFSARLARIATDLMGCRGVRLYHDQALYKEPGGGITPWHADQFYWPLATDRTTTIWIPLQATAKELGPLAFSAQSQRLQKGRDLEISDESEVKIRDYLSASHFSYVEEPFALGEVSFHSGWTFHRAAANVSDRPREVMTIIYFDKDARVAAPRNKHQQVDLETWLAGAQVGTVPNTALNPVLFSYDA